MIFNQSYNFKIYGDDEIDTQLRYYKANCTVTLLHRRKLGAGWRRVLINVYLAYMNRKCQRKRMLDQYCLHGFIEIVTY